MSSKWRVWSREVIADVLLGHPNLIGDDLLKVVSKNYPFGQRENMPYQIWLDEVKVLKAFLETNQPKNLYSHFANQFRSAKDMIKTKNTVTKKTVEVEGQLSLF